MAGLAEKNMECVTVLHSGCRVEYSDGRQRVKICRKCLNVMGFCMHQMAKVGLCLLAVAPTFAHAESDSATDKEFQKELLTIEEKVTALKKNVFSAKATLNLLRELVVQGNVSGSKANIWQINELNGGYVVKSAAYVLDGKPIYNINDASGEFGSKNEVMVFEGEMGVSEHTLTVELELAGSGGGLFSYVDDYVFTVRSATSFSSEEGENCVVRTILEKRSPWAYSYEERPNIKFQTICSEFGE